MAINNIGGPIPCAGCGKSIVRGIVYQFVKAEELFICSKCYTKAKIFDTNPDNKLKQFEEN